MKKLYVVYVQGCVRTVLNTREEAESCATQLRANTRGKWPITVVEYTAEEPKRPQGLVGVCRLYDGMATLQDGPTVNLLDVQAVINGAFQEHGDQEYASAADELSKLTGLVQGPHGEWEEA